MLHRFRIIKGCSVSLTPVTTMRRGRVSIRSSSSSFGWGADGRVFFSSEGRVSFRESSGLSPAIVEALERAGYPDMLPAQRSAIPALLRKEGESNNRQHRVLASETGSGKTLSYLSIMVEELGSAKRNAGLVLCPNSALCKQVQDAFEEVFSRTNEGKFPCVEVVQSMVPPQSDTNDDGATERDSRRARVYVSTPSALVQHLDNYYDKGRQKNFVQRLSHVVFDEADALLTGGYEAAIRRIFVLLAYNDVKSRGVEVSDRKDFGKFLGRMMRKMPAKQRESRRLLFVGATMMRRGTKSPGAIIERALPGVLWEDRSPLLHRGFGNDEVTFAWYDVNDDDDDDEADAQRRAMTVDLALSRPCDSSSCDDNAGVPHVTIVFSKTADRADAVARSIRATFDESVAACFAYHGKVEDATRNAWLNWLKNPTNTDARDAAGVSAEVNSVVLCCTDSAARGLDIKSVHHIVQADFASNAIDFVHRVGRTGRAGRPGRVSNICTAKDAELVDAIRTAMNENRTLEEAFSRRRSFKKRLKQGRKKEV
eukprot:g2496.t1